MEKMMEPTENIDKGEAPEKWACFWFNITSHFGQRRAR